MRALPTHTCTCTNVKIHAVLVAARSPGHGAGQEIYVLCRADMVSRLAPSSLGLLHGHTCYSNKLPRAPLESLMDSRGGGVSFLHACGPEETSRRSKRPISIEAGRGLEKLFDHPSWLGAFIRPQQFNDPFTDSRGMR